MYIRDRSIRRKYAVSIESWRKQKCQIFSLKKVDGNILFLVLDAQRHIIINRGEHRNSKIYFLKYFIEGDFRSAGAHTNPVANCRMRRDSKL